jgi:hypothetical protein
LIINKFNIFKSADGYSIGITTFTKLISEILRWSNSEFEFSTFSNYSNDLHGYNILNIGINSSTPIKWLINNRSKCKNFNLYT